MGFGICGFQSYRNLEQRQHLVRSPRNLLVPWNKVLWRTRQSGYGLINDGSRFWCLKLFSLSQKANAVFKCLHPMGDFHRNVHLPVALQTDFPCSFPIDHRSLQHGQF